MVTTEEVVNFVVHNTFLHTREKHITHVEQHSSYWWSKLRVNIFSLFILFWNLWFFRRYFSIVRLPYHNFLRDYKYQYGRWKNMLQMIIVFSLEVDYHWGVINHIAIILKFPYWNRPNRWLSQIVCKIVVAELCSVRSSTLCMISLPELVHNDVFDCIMLPYKVLYCLASCCIATYYIASHWIILHCLAL